MSGIRHRNGTVCLDPVNCPEARAEFNRSRERMSFEDKVRALVTEGGYTRKEAIELLQEMGEDDR